MVMIEKYSDKIIVWGFRSIDTVLKIAFKLVHHWVHKAEIQQKNILKNIYTV
jgi:hypothetical protein